MTKKNTVYFVCLNLLLTAFMGCEGVAELFHGPKPEEVPPPVTYTVTYVANGVTGVVPPAQTVNAGTTIVLPDQGTLALSGKIFTGWNTAEDGTGTGYAARSNFTVTGGITLYAQWAIPYTVIYDANGRTGSPPPSQTAGAGTSIIVGSGSGLNKPGYGFAGWNTVADGSGIGCAAGSSLTVTGTITLYAQWVITYTVTFDANAATGVVPAVQMANAGTTIILPDQGGLVLLGKIFTGWNTAADGTGTSYMAGLSFEVNADTTLYAQWSVTPPMEYTVTYNANGGSGSLSPQTVYDGTSIIAGSGNGLSRSGYAFTGWNTAAAGTGTAYAAGSSLTVTGDITLYAQWVITYTVTFDAGEGSPSQTRTVTSGSSLGSDMPSDPTRSGYNFGGWYTAVDGGGSVFTAAATVTGSITVYAWWLDTSLQYTVTFNTGEGSPATRLVTNGSSVGSAMPSTPTKSGYSFNGWYTAANGGGSIFTAATQVTGNVTVYAWWKIQYTVTFDAAGGSPATNSRTVTDGNSIGSSAMPSTPTWSGRIFHGWYTEISGGTVFTDTTAVTANITVHARWTLDTSIQYTVTFNAAGGGPATQARTVTNGSSLGSPGMPSEPAKAGSDFNGWYTVPNGGGTEFTDATAVTANITVYAWWKMSADLSLDDALTWISNNAVTGGAYTITLQNNETIAPKTLNYSGKTVSITLTGGVAKRIVSLSTTGALFTLEGGVTLILDNNFTLQGRSDNTNPLVRVYSNGTLVMKAGSKIIGNTSSSGGAGGGVFVYVGGTFTMNGGEISGNSESSSTPSACGGGVSVTDGTFTMNGGKISGNSASAASSAYGGGVSVNNGTFTMNGGEISGNSVAASYVTYGGGVYVSSSGSIFKKTGGTITGYGNDTTTGNKVVNSYGAVQSNRGHAVYKSGTQRLENTVTASHNLDSTQDGAAGGWVE